MARWCIYYSRVVDTHCCELGNDIWEMCGHRRHGIHFRMPCNDDRSPEPELAKVPCAKFRTAEMEVLRRAAAVRAERVSLQSDDNSLGTGNSGEAKRDIADTKSERSGPPNS